jgi:hypothetical protein
MLNHVVDYRFILVYYTLWGKKRDLEFPDPMVDIYRGFNALIHISWLSIQR